MDKENDSELFCFTRFSMYLFRCWASFLPFIHVFSLLLHLPQFLSSYLALYHKLLL